MWWVLFLICRKFFEFLIDFDFCSSWFQELHLDYIIAAANLKAFMCNIPANTDRAAIKATVDRVKVPEFTPRSGVRIAANEAEAAASNNDSLGVC